MEQLDFIDSKFRLAILAAKRAKQLVNGAKKKLDITAENPLTISLKEIYAGKVNFRVLEEGELPNFDKFDEAVAEEEAEALLFRSSGEDDDEKPVFAADDDDDNEDEEAVDIDDESDEDDEGDEGDIDEEDKDD